MPNDTRTIDLVINNLTEEQFENVFSPDPNELWLTPDDTPEQLAEKVDKTSEANKTYGTDAQGNQITYSTPTIPTVNNPTITITQGGVTKGSFTLNQSSAGTIALDAGGGGSVDIDNSTITKNGSDQLQAVATVNANTAVGATNPIYDWVGTLAEYTAQAVATNHPDWVCYITDDLTTQAYDAYSKSQTDTLLAGKVSTGHEVIAFQEPNSGNNYTWYRIYADGWVEQGSSNPVATGTTVLLPVEMADSNYSASSSIVSYTGTDAMGADIVCITKTTTTIKLGNTRNWQGIRFIWEVKGMAA